MYVVYYMLDTRNTYYPNRGMISVGESQSPFGLTLPNECQWMVPGTVDPRDD